MTRPRKLRLLAAALALSLAPSSVATAAGAASDDPSLRQQLDDLPIVEGEHIIDAGHVDLGPKFDGDQWRFMIHDDAARADADAKSVWRFPEQTVFHVVDEAELDVPDDPAYAFLGVDAGDPVWVIPQTQDRDVVWVGWNTQDPQVMKVMDRGATFSLTGVDGPGDLSVYLQSGSFGEPEVLWDSRKPEAQPVFVEINTHTHANWVFSRPGVYLVRMKVESELVDGSTVSDTQLLRFAVGSGTSTDEALAATWSGPAEPDGETTTAAANGSSDPLVPILVGAVVVVAVLLVVGFTVAIVRSGRARRRVLASRAGTTDGADT